MRRALTAVALAALAVVTGCGDTGQPAVRYAAHLVPAPVAPVQVGGLQVTLTEARMAFGPAYFCASASSSATLCDTALAELRAVTRVDLLDPRPQAIGTVEGFEGALRSASYDLGIDWFATDERPVASAAAPDGHSVVFAGVAAGPAGSVRFRANVDVVPPLRGQRAVPTQAVDGGGSGGLVVRVDPTPWLAVVDFEALAANGSGERLIEPDSRDHDALVLAITAQRPVEMEWK